MIELLKQRYLFTAMPTTQGLKPECPREHGMYMECTWSFTAPKTFSGLGRRA